MKLTLEHIGSIHSAAIELRGLTVIAGENDTGKSTVGRVFFALAQAYSNFPIAVRKQQSIDARRILENLYFAIRREVDMEGHRDLLSFFSSVRSHAADINNLPLQEIREMVEQLFNENKLSERSRVNVQRQIDNLYQLAKQESNDEGAIGALAHRALKSEFSGEILSRPEAEAAIIKLSDGATTILEMSLNDKRVVDFKGGHPLGLRDATLVEGPAILQYSPMFRWYDSTGEGLAFAPGSAPMPYHTIDLWNKLQRSPVKIGADKEFGVEFSSICKAEMYFDDKVNNFFLKKGALKIPANNVASGIKALSIIDMLSKGDYVSDDTMLILDEPETNLHPTWQISYARAICKLASSGVKILVTTHSPYMVEALRGSLEENFENANFYLAQRQDERVVYTDTLGNISPIVEALSAPLRDFLEEIQYDEF